MSRRLLDRVNMYLAEKGPAGKAELCVAVNRSVVTLDRWIRDGVPNAHYAYKLARAVGCTKNEALALASEDIEEGAKETA